MKKETTKKQWQTPRVILFDSEDHIESGASPAKGHERWIQYTKIPSFTITGCYTFTLYFPTNNYQTRGGFVIHNEGQKTIVTTASCVMAPAS